MKLTVTHIAVSVSLALICSPMLVASIMIWSGEFDPIVLQDIQSKDQVREGSSSAEIQTDGNAEISANNTTTAQLSSATDTLVTEYKLTFDGDGVSTTGGSTVDFTSYDSFLSSPAPVSYVADDDFVMVTLYVRATNYAGDLADAGTYSAAQTLTVHWVGP